MSERGCKSKAGGSASGRALMGSSSPPFPLQHCSLLLRWLSTSYRRREPLQQKKRKRSPHCHLSLESFAPSAAADRNQILSPCCQRDSPRAAACRVQVPVADAGGAALRLSSLLTGEEAEHISREEGKQRSQTHLLFPPSSLAPAPTAPTSWMAGHCPRPLGRACPRGCGRKAASVVFPPSPASVTAAPLRACCGIWLPCSHGAVGHGSRLIPHRHQLARCLWLSNLRRPCAPVP